MSRFKTTLYLNEFVNGNMLMLLNYVSGYDFYK